jgi:two-component system, OmpR family, sensor kinase
MATAAEALEQARLLPLLEKLLDLPVWDEREALTSAANDVARWVQCDKVDVFLFDAGRNALVAIGTSDTPLGRRQKELGLDVLPIDQGGRMVETYQTGRIYFTGHAEQDEGELPGIVRDLGARSEINAPIEIAGTRRGVLSLFSQQPEYFPEQGRQLIGFIARWVGALAHRAELVQKLRAEEMQRARRTAAEEMLSVLSHDMRNHLAPLTSRLQVLKMRLGRGRPVQAPDLDPALAAVARLTRLTEELLDVTRLDQGLFQLELAPVDLIGLLRDAAQALAGPNVEVVVEAPESLLVSADAKRLQQALENVIANGVRHSPPGSPLRIVVTSSENEPLVRVDVIDQGPGIAPELIPHLFERFTSGPRSQGIGLGLYLAERIARAHGGSLKVKSTPGAGACFVFCLPKV